MFIYPIEQRQFLATVPRPRAPAVDELPALPIYQPNNIQNKDHVLRISWSLTIVLDTIYCNYNVRKRNIGAIEGINGDLNSFERLLGGESDFGGEIFV